MKLYFTVFWLIACCCFLIIATEKNLVISRNVSDSFFIVNTLLNCERFHGYCMSDPSNNSSCQKCRCSNGGTLMVKNIDTGSCFQNCLGTCTYILKQNGLLVSRHIPCVVIESRLGVLVSSSDSNNVRDADCNVTGVYFWNNGVWRQTGSSSLDFGVKRGDNRNEIVTTKELSYYTSYPGNVIKLQIKCGGKEECLVFKLKGLVKYVWRPQTTDSYVSPFTTTECKQYLSGNQSNQKDSLKLAIVLLITILGCVSLLLTVFTWWYCWTYRCKKPGRKFLFSSKRESTLMRSAGPFRPKVVETPVSKRLQKVVKKTTLPNTSINDEERNYQELESFQEEAAYHIPTGIRTIPKCYEETTYSLPQAFILNKKYEESKSLNNDYLIPDSRDNRYVDLNEILVERTSCTLSHPQISPRPSKLKQSLAVDNNVASYENPSIEDEYFVLEENVSSGASEYLEVVDSDQFKSSAK